MLRAYSTELTTVKWKLLDTKKPAFYKGMYHLLSDKLESMEILNPRGIQW